MKKIFFVFAAAALLASCSQNEGVSLLNIEDNGDKAVTFEAFARTAVTKGTVETVDHFTTQGIGVFAFYQPANGIGTAPDYTSIKYPNPDFMYNQRIQLQKVGSGDAGAWYYTPVKYWPNNEGDKLSFFAYAPYEDNYAWEDINFKTNSRGTVITKTFIINNTVDEQDDYLFAEPVMNKTKPGTISHATNASGNATYADVSNYASSDATIADDVIRFDFKHILSKVNIYLGVQTDVNIASGDGSKTTSCTKWEDGSTTIEIQSIKFKNLYQTYTWTSNASPKWTGDGKQDITVTPSSDDNADIISSTTWTSAKWHRVLDCADPASGDATGDEDEYMFIAPQILSSEEVIITYVVKTQDTTHPENSSEITNVITKTWKDFKNADFTAFESGKQYRLYFIIGMQGVKVAATVTDWADASNPESVIDVPAANAF